MPPPSIDPAPCGRVFAIYRYPVKGLSAEPLDTVDVSPGETIPWDRAFAIENGPARFDPFAPRYLPKIGFLMLMRNAALATLQTSFDAATETLTISRDGHRIAEGRLTTPAGRAIIGQFFAEYMKDDLRGPPRIVHAHGHSISDTPEKCVHIVNLTTLVDLERITATRLDPLRFRANLVIGGAPAWSELDWVGRDLTIGEARFSVFERTERCAATNVNPATGRRDIDIPAALLRARGHSDFGVYARITSGGTLSPGMPVSII